MKHIAKRAEKRALSDFDKFLKRALATFKIESGRRRIALGAFLTTSLDYMSSADVEDFFFTQVQSPMVSDRKRAYVAATRIWSQRVEECVWKSWDIFADINAIAVLSELASVAVLAHRFDDLWHSEWIPRRIKNRMLARVAQHSFRLIKNIRHSDPISYLSACVHAQRKPKPSEALALVQQANSTGQLGYGIWCLGKLGMFDTLRDLGAKLPSMEKAMEERYVAYNPGGELA